MTKKLGFHLQRTHLLFALALVLVGASVSLAQDKSTKGEAKWATLDGNRIHYMNYSKGDEALVLVHGWTQNIDGWRDQIDEFAKRYHVIAIDLPGHGKSDKPRFLNEAVPKDQPSPPFVYSMDLFARAIDAVMRDAKVKRAVLVGHSMGTPVARQFYRKYPQKTLAIVIVDGSLRPFANKAMMDQLIAGFRGPNYRDAVNQMMTAISGQSLAAEARDRIKASSFNTPQYVLVSAMEGMADASIWGEDKITVPVLAIMAKNPFYPPNVEESFRGIAPNMQFQMWDNVGHFIMMEKPLEFNTAVVQWLAKNKLLKK
jgi:pimeloyl-ACP methyl ester carboxylesterase